MEMVHKKTKITVETTVNAPEDLVWNFWTLPKHIMNWNNASADWHTPRAENDLKAGGKFLYRMEAKDGSFGFDFWGVYEKVKMNESLEFTLGDSRKVVVTFTDHGNKTGVSETFETEDTNSIELQRFGWQSILDNFKKYTETTLQQ
jgi:uncharacterized protein YndB with AHSA1/START domain